MFLTNQSYKLFSKLNQMKYLLILCLLTLSSCSFFKNPTLRKYSVRMWSDDNAVNLNFSQIMTLVEKDKSQLIYLVNNIHFDTLHLEGKKVFGALHSVYVNEAHVYDFEGVIVNKSGNDFLINGKIKSDQSGNFLNYEIY